MANLNAPVGLAAGTASTYGLVYTFIVSPAPFAFDGNPSSSRAYPNGGELTRVYVSGAEPGVSAEGDDRDHE